MLKLISGNVISDEIKQNFKTGVVRAYIKLEDGTILNSQDYIQSIKLEDYRYNDETEQFIGEAVAKRATVKIYNENNDFNLENKEFELFIGAKKLNSNINNLFNINDINIKSEQITIDNDDYITATYDNLNGDEAVYLNLFTNVSSDISTNTIYYAILEVENVFGSGGIYITDSATEKINFSELSSNGIYKYQLNTLDSFSKSNAMLKTYVKFLPNESGSIKFRLSLVENDVDLETFKYQKFSREFEYISFGNFIVQEPENDDTKETSEVEALDYMCKLNQPYKLNVTLPCTYADMAEDACNQCGVELGSRDFRNADKLIYDNPFVNNEQCRFVIKQIAKIAFSWARIRQDNKLYFDLEVKKEEDVVEEFTLDDYIDLKPNEKLVPINTIVLRMTDVEGENVTIKDNSLISEYGVEKDLIVEEDYFAYTEELRRDLIKAASELFGLVYAPIELNSIGTIYLEGNDYISITNKQDDKVYSYCFNHTINYNGTLYDDIETPAMTEVQEKYKHESDEDLTRRRTEVKVDKANQRIDILTKEVSDYEDKLADITVTVDRIEQAVQNVADITRQVKGTKKITLPDCLLGELLELHIYGNNTVFDNLYPSDNLFPSETLYPYGDSLIKISTRNQIPTSSKYYENGYYDIESLENLIPKIETIQLNAYITTYATSSSQNIHFSDEKWNYYSAIRYTQNSHNFYYLKINPNSKYIINSNLNQLPEGNSWAIGVTSNLDWIKEAQTENFNNILLNNSRTNSYYDNEWKNNPNITSFEIETKSNDEYLILYGANSIVGNRINEISIYDVTESHYLKAINPISVEPNSNIYFSLNNNNDEFRFVNLYFYDKENNYIIDWNSLYSDNKISDLIEKQIIIPENCYSLDYIIRRNNFEDVEPSDILVVKPQLEYGTQKTEFIDYNTQIIDLGVTTVLRQLGEVYDEYVLTDNKAQIIRRIGITNQGVLYVLSEPIIEDLGELVISLVRGDNIIEILNYSANMLARYVIINEFTDKFVTTVELRSAIEILANQINLEVSRKVGNDEIIARINMAVLGKEDTDIPEDVEKSIIEILANKISIKSDYFELTKEGSVTATEGHIAGLDMWQDYSASGGYRSWLTKDFQEGTNVYRSGILVKDTDGYNTDFIFAGMPISGNSWNTANANLRIYHDGEIRAKWFSINGENGYLHINYDNGNSAMHFTKSGIDRYLSNGNRWTSEGIGYQNTVASMHSIWLYDAKAFSIESGIHNTALARFYRIGNSGEAAEIDFYANAYINGQQIQVASSDERMKENIKDSELEALTIIDKIEFKQFDWKKDSGNEGHVDIGFIAQKLEKVYDKLVIHNITRENEVYSIDLLNTLSLTMKGVQELNQKIEKQQKIIDFLLDKLDYKEGLEEYLKGE